MNSSNAQKMDQKNEQSVPSTEVTQVNAAKNITEEGGKRDEPIISTTAGGSSSYREPRAMFSFRSVTNLASSETDSDFEDWEECKRPVRMPNTKLMREMEATFKNVIEDFEEMYVAENRPPSRMGDASELLLTIANDHVGPSNRNKRKVEDTKNMDSKNPIEPTNKKQKN